MPLWRWTARWCWNGTFPPWQGRRPLPLEGANGIQLTVELSPEGARVASSTCPDQVCVHTGLLTRAGESAICLPARATLRLEGGGDAIDATVY